MIWNVSQEPILLFSITATHHSGRTVVRPVGELDMQSAARLADCVLVQVENDRVDITVDLEALTFCDSRGLAALIEAAARCQRAGGSLVLTGATGAVARVLAITGVGELLADGTPWAGRWGPSPQPKTQDLAG